MTLIISELCNFAGRRAIVMAADTAQTVGSMNTGGLVEDRSFFGLTKLLPIKKINAGISYWGWAKMPPDSDDGVWMDWWLKQFLVRNRNNFATINDLAAILEEELRRVVPPITNQELKDTDNEGTGGIHLAGFLKEEEQNIPAFWHIHNGKSQALLTKKLDPLVVNANYDCPPAEYLRNEKKGARRYQTTNGDIKPYALFFRKYLKDYLVELYEKMDYVIPIPNVDFEANFMRSQIKFISGLYAVGGYEIDGTIKQLPRGIGGNVTTLTITEEGIQKYQDL